MKKLLCLIINKVTIIIITIALCFPFMCCQRDYSNIDGVLAYAYSNYYENKDSQSIMGYYDRKYFLSFIWINRTDEDLSFPLYLYQGNHREPVFRFYYKGQELNTLQRFFGYKNHDYDFIEKGVFPANDTLYTYVEIFEKTLEDAGISKRTDIRCVLDTIEIYYLNKLNFSSKKDMKEGIIKQYNKYKPIIIYTETKRLPWEKGQKILRLNRHTME